MLCYLPPRPAPATPNSEPITAMPAVEASAAAPAVPIMAPAPAAINGAARPPVRPGLNNTGTCHNVIQRRLE